MSVQLEWEIDDVDAPLPDDSTEHQRPTSGCRRWGRFFGLIALILAAGLLVLGFRIRQKHKEIERELRAVAQLELKALQVG